MSEVISFAAFQRRQPETKAPAEWTNSERAELYRVEAILHQSGIAIETDEGVSDEGDPWFVFCRPDGDVLIHIARLDGQYSFHSPALTHPLRGRSFSELCSVFQDLFPLRVAVREKEPSNVLFHPAAILSLVVGTIFLSFDEMLSTRAEAATLDAPPPSPTSEVQDAEAFALPHDPVPTGEAQKLIEQFQSLAAKNLKAVLSGRAENTQNPSYIALTNSLLIFAAGGLDVMTQSALADETKPETHLSIEPLERHGEGAGLSYDVGVAREHDHVDSRLPAGMDEAKLVSGRLVFSEEASGQHQAEVKTITTEHHVDNTSASIHFDFSQPPKFLEPSKSVLPAQEHGVHVEEWQGSSQGSTSESSDAAARGLELSTHEAAHTQAQVVAVVPPTEASQPSAAASSKVAASPAHEVSTASRIDTTEVLLSFLPDQMGLNFHLSKEPVKFVLGEWDKVVVVKDTAGTDAEIVDTGKSIHEAPSTPATNLVPNAKSEPLPDSVALDGLSEKLNSVELALYNKVLDYQAGGGMSHFDLNAKNLILKFVEKAADIEIIMSDHVIMFVDEAVHASVGSTPYMRIWETSDGEAISIVGVVDPNHPTFA